jgi:hypothetical protein
MNSEDRATRFPALDIHATAMSLDDRSHDGETHSEPLRLRGEKRLEHLPPHLGRQARSSISHEELHLAASR